MFIFKSRFAGYDFKTFLISSDFIEIVPACNEEFSVRFIFSGLFPSPKISPALSFTAFLLVEFAPPIK